MKVTMNRVAAIALPAGMYTNNESAGFVDAIPLPDSSVPDARYRSAALVFGPASGDPTQENMGVVAYNKRTQEYEFHLAPQGTDPAVSWPTTGSCQAACGLSGGMVAFAVQTETGGAIQVHHSVLSNGSWGMIGAPLAFNDTTIQCMLEHQGLLYVFLKAAENGFLSWDFKGGVNEQFDPGTAAAAFFPKASKQGDTQFMLRTIAACDHNIYAIDETYTHVKCGSFDPQSLQSFPLAFENTWGLLIDQDRKKAYGVLTVPNTAGEFILPYVIADSGPLERKGNAIKSGYPVCPTIDEKLGLLYLPSAAAPFQVISTDTDTVVTFTGNNAPSLANFEGVTAGSWADAEQGIFYAAGKLHAGDPPSNILVYEVTVTEN